MKDWTGSTMTCWINFPSALFSKTSPPIEEISLHDESCIICSPSDTQLRGGIGGANWEVVGVEERARTGEVGGVGVITVGRFWVMGISSNWFSLIFNDFVKTRMQACPCASSAWLRKSLLILPVALHWSVMADKEETEQLLIFLQLTELSVSLQVEALLVSELSATLNPGSVPSHKQLILSGQEGAAGTTGLECFWSWVRWFSQSLIQF